MRRILAVLLGVLLSGQAVWALSLSDLTLNGEIRNRGFYISNYLGKGNSDNYYLTRALLDVGLQATPNAKFVVTVGATRLWGTNDTVYQVEEPGAAQSVKPGIYNAYLKVSPFKELAITAGRQYAGEKDDAFFFYGPERGRFLEVTSLDALRADVQVGVFEAYALAGKKAESDAAQTQWGVGQDMDQDILALGVKSTQLVENQKFTLDMYQRRIGQQPTWVQPDNLYLVVLRSTGLLPWGLDYDAMGGLNAGSDHNADRYTGWLARGILNYTIPENAWVSVRFNEGYVYVSGDTNTSDGKDGNFRRMSRDCFYNMALLVYELLNDTAPENVTNVAIPFTGVEIVPKVLDEKLKLKAMYSYLVAPAPITVRGTVANTKGQELYLRAEYPLMEGVQLELTASRFWPGDLFKAAYISSDPYNQMTLDVTLNF